MNVGSWMPAPFPIACALPEKVATAFAEATMDLRGAEYIPLLYCGEQLVDGTNYVIICGQIMITNPPVHHIVKMIIHAPLEGKASIANIEIII